MTKRNLLIAWFLILNLFVWTSPPLWAVPLSLDLNIKTILANRAESSEGFDFVVMGDSRDGTEIYERLLNRAKAFNPLFILNTGDFVESGRPFEYENYMRHIAACDIPILHVPGNHEVLVGVKTFRKYVGEPNWYFDLGDFRIIGLDNADGRFSAKALAFAQKTLTSQKICLVAFHMPPAIGRWTAHAMVNNEKKGHGGEVMALIKDAKVPMVFLGHIHLYDEMDVDGTKYIISAGGGATLYSKYNFGKPEYGFVLVHVRSKGITHRWVPLD